MQIHWKNVGYIHEPHVRIKRWNATFASSQFDWYLFDLRFASHQLNKRSGSTRSNQSPCQLSTHTVDIFLGFSLIVDISCGSLLLMKPLREKCFKLHLIVPSESVEFESFFEVIVKMNVCLISSLILFIASEVSKREAKSVSLFEKLYFLFLFLCQFQTTFAAPGVEKPVGESTEATLRISYSGEEQAPIKSINLQWTDDRVFVVGTEVLDGFDLLFEFSKEDSKFTWRPDGEGPASVAKKTESLARYRIEQVFPSFN